MSAPPVLGGGILSAMFFLYALAGVAAVMGVSWAVYHYFVELKRRPEPMTTTGWLIVVVVVAVVAYSLGRRSSG